MNVWFGLVDAATSRSLRFTGWEKNRKMNSDTDRSESLIDVAYDAKLMRECGRRLVDVLSDHLQRVQAGMSSVQDWRDPEENIAKAKAPRASFQPPSSRQRTCPLSMASQQARHRAF